MRILFSEIKRANKIDSPVILNIMIFIKYIPILILLNDWLILPNFGFYFIMGKLTLGNLFRKLQNLGLIKLSFVFLFILTIISLSILFTLYKRLKDENKDKFTKIILLISQFLFYVFYMFPNLIHQIIYINAASDLKCSVEKSTKENLINSDSTMKTDDNIICTFNRDYTNLGFSCLFMLITIYLNYKFDIFIPNINNLNASQINAKNVNSVDYLEIFSPLLHAIIVFEIFQFPSRVIIFIKLVFRALFVLNSLINLRRMIFLENNFEFMLNYFGLFTSLSDFLFLKEFMGLSAREDFLNVISNPEYFSLVYSLKFQLIKILLAISLTACLLSLRKNFEHNFLADFYMKTKGNDNFRYYCKFFKFVRNFDNYSANEKFSFISNLHFKIKLHFQNCKYESCTCKLANGIFESFIQEESIDYKKMKILMINFLEINISEFNQRNRANEQKIALEHLLLEVYYFYYFKNFQIRCVFNLEKILAFNIVKKNKIFYERINLYKLDIINSFLITHGDSELINKKKDLESEEIKLYFNSSEINFLNKNKEKKKTEKDLASGFSNSPNDFNVQTKFNSKNQKSFQKLFVNFSHFYEFMKLQNKIEESFKNFKLIIQKFYLRDYFFQEFLDDLNNLLISLLECNFSVNQILKNYMYHSNLNLKNIAIYSKFFYDENIYKRIYPQRNFQEDLDSNESMSEKYNNRFLNSDNKYTEKIILKQNNKQKLTFEKVNPNFCSELGYSSKEFLTKELDEILPSFYSNFHNKNIQEFIKKNQLIIKNKEVFFIGKEGYCINYKLSCAVLITLEEEILFFCELQKISDLNPNFTETAFGQCFSDGQIIAYDIGIKKHLFLDSYILNLIKLNLFKNLLCLSKQALDGLLKSKANYEIFDVPYLEILENVKQVDFSKIIDLRNQEHNNYIFMKRLNNAINYHSEGNCVIEIFKRYVNKDISLFDVRFDFSKITKVNFKLDIANLIFLEDSKKDKKKKEANFVPNNIHLKIIQKEKDFFKKFLKNIRYVTYTYKKYPGLILKNLKTLEEFSEEYTTTESPMKVGKLYTSINKYFKQNKIKIEEFNISICFWNRIVYVFIFLGIFVAIYYHVNLLNDGLYEKARTFIDFSCITIMLKYYTITLSHSYFSINLIQSGLEPPNFNYMSNNFDNSIQFHFDLLKNRADNFLENAYHFQNLYNTHGSYLLESNDTVYESFAISELNSDWSASANGSFSMSQNMFLFHYITDRTTMKEINNTKFNLFNYTQNSRDHFPTKTDKTLFFYMENIVGKLTSGYNKIIKSTQTNFSDYIQRNNMLVFLVYILSGVFAIVYTAFETYILNSAHNKIFMKCFVVYNQLKVYHLTLIKKVELIEEIFTDFTEEALENLKKNSKLLKINLNSETISSKGTNKEKTFSPVKTSEDKASINPIGNERSYFKDYSFISKGVEENSLANSPFPSNTATNNRLQPEKKVNSMLFKVLSKYKESVKNRNALEYSIDHKNSNSNLAESDINGVSYTKQLTGNNENVLIDFNTRNFKADKNEENNINNISDNNKYLKVNNTTYSNYNNTYETQQLKSIEFNATTDKFNLSGINNYNHKEASASQNNMRLGLFNSSIKNLYKDNTKSVLEDSIFPSHLSIVSENKLIPNITNTHTVNKPKGAKNSNLRNILSSNKLSNKNNNQQANNNSNTKKQNELIAMNNHFKDISNKKYVNEEDLENTENVIIQKNFFGKSNSFLFFFRILLLSICLILTTSIVVFTFVVSAYSRIFSNYLISRSFLLRSGSLNELTLIYRYSLINKKIAYGNYTYSEVDLFKNALEDYKTYFSESKAFVDKNDGEFIYLKNFENNMRTKDMCNYYAFYKTAENTTEVENYFKYMNECKIFSGGLNNFGIENSYESMVLIMSRFHGDLENYLESSNKDKIADEDKWLEYLGSKFSDESIQKIYRNLNLIFFDVTQLTLKNINDFNDYFFDDLALKHDWIHYLLFLIVGLVNFYFLFLVYFFIDKPKSIINDVENIVRNSILFNILEVN